MAEFHPVIYYNYKIIIVKLPNILYLGTPPLSQAHKIIPRLLAPPTPSPGPGKIFWFHTWICPMTKYTIKIKREGARSCYCKLQWNKSVLNIIIDLGKSGDRCLYRSAHVRAKGTWLTDDRAVLELSVPYHSHFLLLVLHVYLFRVRSNKFQKLKTYLSVKRATFILFGYAKNDKSALLLFIMFSNPFRYYYTCE